ncbi:hypothetical protein PFISCL1PPCAC_5161, partial [Pristionchus fissidentatus]
LLLSFISTSVIAQVPKIVPIRVLYPPPPESPPKYDSTPETEELRDESHSGSEEPQSKRRKYILKKDAERSDPLYKDMRVKNNESVRRTREKKKAQEEKETRRNKEEKEELRSLIRIMMAREAYLELVNSSLRRNVPEPQRSEMELKEELSPVQKRMYAEIRSDFHRINPKLAEYGRQVRE